MEFRCFGADHCCASDLQNRSKNIHRYEKPKDDFLSPEPAIPISESQAVEFSPGDYFGEAYVDAGGDEDGSSDDQEVLDDEGGDVVGVFLRREGAEYVADCFEEAGYGEGDEGVEAVAQGLIEVREEGEGEEDYG